MDGYACACSVPLTSLVLFATIARCLAVSTEYIVLTGGLHTVSACSVVGLLKEPEQ